MFEQDLGSLVEILLYEFKWLVVIGGYEFPSPFEYERRAVSHPSAIRINLLAPIQHGAKFLGKVDTFPTRRKNNRTIFPPIWQRAKVQVFIARHSREPELHSDHRHARHGFKQFSDLLYLSQLVLYGSIARFQSLELPGPKSLHYFMWR